MLPHPILHVVHVMDYGMIRYPRPLYIPTDWRLQGDLQAAWSWSIANRTKDAALALACADPETKWENITWWAINADRWLIAHGVRYEPEIAAIRARAMILKKGCEGQITSREAIREAYLEWLGFVMTSYPEPPTGWIRVGNREYVWLHQPVLPGSPGGEAG